MQESGNADFILKKAYEISYALWRIAANISERNLADKIFSRAIDMIGDAVDGNYRLVAAKLPGLEFIIKFSGDINAISLQNSAILMEEISNLKAAIAELPVAGIPESLPEIDISGIFSDNHFDEPSAGPPEETGNIKAENRQTAILERIRQFGNCRLNDIQAILPDTSERTLRYDLETLVQKNLVERIGTGGRGTYYQAKS